MRFRGAAAVAVCLLAGFHQATAGGAAGEGIPAAGTISLAAKGELEMAEMLKARVCTPGAKGQSSSWDHSWYTHLLATLDFAARPVSAVTIKGSFEFRQYFHMSAISTFEKAYYMGDFKQNEFFIREAQGILSVVKNSALSVGLSFGLMPYKYNGQVRELGEFLFRSGTYPFFLQTDFDRPFARLTGLMASMSAGDDAVQWNLDLMALTEREVRPYYDISFAALAGLNLYRLFEVGCGVDFARALSMHDKYTSPTTEGFPPQTNTTYLLYYATRNADSTCRDTGYYTFKGTKLMARVTIDPLGRMRGKGESFLSGIAGKDGGKLYGEMAVIGLESYPKNDQNMFGYDKLKEKMPWMLGFNIPVWKLLDVCTFEIERYPNPAPNSTLSNLFGQPVCAFTIKDSKTADYDTNNTYRPRWYWSLYMEKQVNSNLSVVCQMGRDHERWEMPLAFSFFNYDYEEALVKPDEWGWHVKLVFHL